MALHDARLFHGTLKIGPTASALDMSCQITNCRITSAYSDDGNAIQTLCGDTIAVARKLDGHKLEGTFVQDFDTPAPNGVLAYVWLHDLEILAFEFLPDDTGAPTITGTLQMEIPGDTFGGDVNTRNTSDFAWNLQTKPTFAWPTARGAEAEAKPAPKEKAA